MPRSTPKRPTGRNCSPSWGWRRNATPPSRNSPAGRSSACSSPWRSCPDPQLVFLDELTTGLDPQARHAIWDLVRDVRAKGKTVLLTTHFMEEAERLCDRVAILDHGRIVALDTPAALIRSLGAEERVVFSLDGALPAGFEKALSGAVRLEVQGEQVIVHGKNGRKVPLVSEVVSLLTRQGIQFRDLRTEQPTLEDVFLSLTGREMRE